jgi:hypothetical protein
MQPGQSIPGRNAVGVDCQHIFQADKPVFIRFDNTTKPEPRPLVPFILPNNLEQQTVGAAGVTLPGSLYAFVQ